MPLTPRYDRKRFEELRAKRGAPWLETLGTSGFGRLADIPRGVGNRMSQPGMEFMKERNRNERRAKMQARLEEVGGMAPGPEGEGAPAGGAQALLDQMPGKGEGLDMSTSLLPPGGVLPEHAGLDFESFRSNPIGSGGARPAPAPRPAPPAAEELPNAAPGLDIGPGSEARFAQDERDAKLERAKRMQSISEGLNLAGRSIAGLSGAKIPELDDRDYAAEREIAGMEDQLTASERQALEAVGLKLPPGTRRSTLSSILPAITGMRQQGLRQQAQAGAARTASEARAEKETTRVREREEDITRKTGERREDIGIAEEKFRQMSDKEIAQLTQMDEAIEGFKAIGKEREEKGYSTGPLDKPLAKLGAMTGVLSAESAEWRRKVTSRLNAYIKEMTGAQLSASEAKRLMAGLPTESDQEYIFDAKIQGVIEELERKREGFLQSRRWAGKSTESFELIPFDVPGKGRANVPGGDIEAFKVRYPDAARRSRG